jgi:hypothetical protein
MSRKKLQKFLGDAKRELKRLNMLNLSLNLMIISLVFVIIFQFFRLPIIYAIFPVIFYFISKLTKRFSHNFVINKIGEKYPSLYEKLKTAYDNRSTKNVVVEDLLESVSQETEAIKTSRFLDVKHTTSKIFMIVILLFIFLSINFINFSIYFTGFNPWDILKDINAKTGGFLPIEITPQGQTTSEEEWEIGNYSNEEEMERLGGEGGGKLPGFSKGPIPGEGGGAGATPDEDIFGEPSSAKISGEEIKMQIHPEYGGEIEIKDESKKRKSKEEFLRMTMAKGAEIPSREPLEYEEIIKRYFEKLLKEEKK